MKARADKIAWPAVFLVAASLLAAPASAQFEEPDTVPRFAVGAFVELQFRGSMGLLTETNEELSFKNGPLFGARMEFRAGRTATLAVAGSYGRSREKRAQGGGTDAILDERTITLLQVTGELLLRMKPSVPGYLLVGGGARFVDPEPWEPGESGTRLGQRNFTEAMGIAGAGLEISPGGRSVVHIDARFYLVKPEVEPEENWQFDAKSFVTNFALSVTYLYRL